MEANETGQGGRLGRRLAHLRLLVGRVRLYAPEMGWSRAVSVAFRDRRGATGEITLDWPGYPAPFHLRAGGTDVLTFHQVVARNGYEMPFEVDGCPSVIIDAGANVGMSSVWYAARYPDARVIAIEPEPGNYAQLLRNVAPYGNIEPIEAALWSSPGAIRIADPTAGAFAFRAEQASADEEGVVPAVTLGQIVADHGLAEISILKIDVEGSEKEVFEADTSWLGIVGAIAIELHDRFKPGCREAFDRATTEFPIRETIKDETFVRRARQAVSASS